MTISPPEILGHMEVPGTEDLYVVGVFEKRVTLYSQQIRALNLVYALHEKKRLKKHAKVCVIGGGPAGLTVALGAATFDCKVTVLEERESLLSTFEGNFTRWIHPNIYDWPRPTATIDTTDLPFLNWRAGSADRVRKQLIEAFDNHSCRSKIFCELGTTGLSIDQKATDGRRVFWYSSGGRPQPAENAFDVVIVATGFGAERTVGAIPSVSYWDNDGLHQARRRGRVLISGTGDGGLVDLLRTSIVDFQPDVVVNTLLNPELLPSKDQERLKREVETLTKRLPTIDEEAMKLPAVQRNHHLVKGYRELNVPRISKLIGSRRRRTVTPVFNGADHDPLNIDASILNRFLVSRLLYAKGDSVRYWAGMVDNVNFDGRHYAVTVGGDPSPERFDHVVIRHGPVDNPPSALSWIWKRCSGLRERNLLDQSRVRSWPDGLFKADVTIRARLPANSRDALVHGFFSLEGGQPIVVWPRFRLAAANKAPSSDDVQATHSADLDMTNFVDTRPRKDITSDLADYVTAEGDYFAMKSIQEIFSELGEAGPVARFDDEITNDLSHRTLIFVGLYSNAQTLATISEALSGKVQLKTNVETDEHIVYLPASGRYYRTEIDDVDYGIVARTQYRDRTVIIVGGMTERGTRRLGHFVRSSWRTMAERTKQESGFVDIYRIPVDVSDLALVDHQVVPKVAV